LVRPKKSPFCKPVVKKPEKDLFFPVAIQSTNDTPRLELFSEAEDEDV